MEDQQLENLKNYFELLAQIIPLGNWRISLEGTGSHSMSHFAGEPDAYGVCLKVREMQYADIYINTEKDHTDKYGETWEHTLIHEILHVVTDELCEHVEGKYSDIVEDPLYYSKVERLINILSYAIYNALDVGATSTEECCGCSCGNEASSTDVEKEVADSKSTVKIAKDTTKNSGKTYLNNPTELNMKKTIPKQTKPTDKSKEKSTGGKKKPCGK